MLFGLSVWSVLALLIVGFFAALSLNAIKLTSKYLVSIHENGHANYIDKYYKENGLSPILSEIKFTKHLFPGYGGRTYNSIFQIWKSDTKKYKKYIKGSAIAGFLASIRYYVTHFILPSISISVLSFVFSKYFVIECLVLNGISIALFSLGLFLIIIDACIFRFGSDGRYYFHPEKFASYNDNNDVK